MFIFHFFLYTYYMKRIYIVKHGETDYNIEKDKNHTINQPKTSELNNNGKTQSIDTGIYLKNRDPIDIIISSPTLRSKQTAELIAKQIGYKIDNIIYENKLEEINVNKKYQNLKISEFDQLKYKDESVTNFFKFHERKSKMINPIERNEYIIKYESNIKNDIYEDPKLVSTRIQEFIEGLKNLPSKNILIITHGGIIKWFNKILMNNIGYDEFNGKLINNKSNCAITSYLYQENIFYLVSAQSNYHLKRNND